MDVCVCVCVCVCGVCVCVLLCVCVCARGGGGGGRGGMGGKWREPIPDAEQDDQSPSLISLMVSVDVKHHVYLLTIRATTKKGSYESDVFLSVDSSTLSHWLECHRRCPPQNTEKCSPVLFRLSRCSKHWRHFGRLSPGLPSKGLAIGSWMRRTAASPAPAFCPPACCCSSAIFA